MDKRKRIGTEHPNYQGGKTISHNYVVLSSKEWGNNQGRYEHRVVMEHMLGRPLKAFEIIHHKNGNTQDNRPQNLEVTTREKHNRIHGNGRLMHCAACGATKWYSAANIVRLRNQGSDYLCRNCSAKHIYEKTCQRCGQSFDGGRTALYCHRCTKKRK